MWDCHVDVDSALWHWLLVNWRYRNILTYLLTYLRGKNTSLWKMLPSLLWTVFTGLWVCGLSGSVRGGVVWLQELSRSTEVVATNGAKMLAVVILAHALRHFSEQAVREISEQSGTALSNDDVRWVVTVPAIWTAAAKQLMRQAAYDVRSTLSFWNSDLGQGPN